MANGGEKEREGQTERETEEKVGGGQVSSAFKEVHAFVCCSSVRTRVLATMYAFACMSMLMSTHS